MDWLFRTLRVPAGESKMGVVLAFCVMSMSFMSLALAWQAQIIAQQRETVQWLAKLKLGG